MTQYSQILPHSDVKPIPPGTHLGPGSIDYSRHPKYARFVATTSLWSRLQETARFMRWFLIVLVKRAIDYERIPRTFRSPRSLSDRLKFVTTAMANLGKSRRGQAYSLDNAAATTMRDHGVVVLQMPPKRVLHLEQLSSGQFATLSARRGSSEGGREFDESRAAADPRDEVELYDFINEVFAEAGVFEIAAWYKGHRLRLIDVNPQINDASDNFWQEIFPDDLTRALPRTAYFHRDASGGDLKAIIYLTDVTGKNGPFSYAAGSNRLSVSRLDNLFQETNDHNGLAATTEEVRRRFAALPERLRQKGSFGNDLPDDDTLARTILQSAWDITGAKGSIVLFDTKGIHRGGMVQQGERRVITCVLG